MRSSRSTATKRCSIVGGRAARRGGARGGAASRVYSLGDAAGLAVERGREEERLAVARARRRRCGRRPGGSPCRASGRPRRARGSRRASSVNARRGEQVLEAAGRRDEDVRAARRRGPASRCRRRRRRRRRAGRGRGRRRAISSTICVGELARRGEHERRGRAVGRGRCARRSGSRRRASCPSRWATWRARRGRRGRRR